MAERQLNDLLEKLKALHIEEASILTQIEELNSARATAAPEKRVNGIARGDRVRIQNRVRKPATWTSETEWTEAKERLATVTRVTQEQIHFVTENGTRTWRAPNNLKLLNRKDER
jgi:hypothetical protein